MCTELVVPRFETWEEVQGDELVRVRREDARYRAWRPTAKLFIVRGGQQYLITEKNGFGLLGVPYGRSHTKTD